MNYFLMVKPIRKKIIMNEIIMAKIKMVEIIMAKPTMFKLLTMYQINLAKINVL
jgi:hypothetical protein